MLNRIKKFVKSVFEKKQYYFGYGLWLDVQKMEQRGSKFIGAGVLKNWSLRERRYADIEQDSDGVVNGAVYEIDKLVEAWLDNCEGYPSFYGKEFVTVEVNGRKRKVLVYVMNPEFANKFDDEPFTFSYANGNMESAIKNGIPVDDLYRNRVATIQIGWQEDDEVGGYYANYVDSDEY